MTITRTQLKAWYEAGDYERIHQAVVSGEVDELLLGTPSKSQEPQDGGGGSKLTA